MSTQDALDFFCAVRRRPDLQDRLTGWGPATTTEQLLELAREVGFECSADDLHHAFRQDWIMRWLHHRPSLR